MSYCISTIPHDRTVMICYGRNRRAFSRSRLEWIEVLQRDRQRGVHNLRQPVIGIFRAVLGPESGRQLGAARLGNAIAVFAKKCGGLLGGSGMAS